MLDDRDETLAAIAAALVAGRHPTRQSNPTSKDLAEESFRCLYEAVVEPHEANAQELLAA